MSFTRLVKFYLTCPAKLTTPKLSYFHVMEETGDAHAVTEERVDAAIEAKPEKKRKPLNCHQKMALVFLSIFMGIVLTSSILYTCIFLILFPNIFKLENMILVFCGFLFACLLYIICCIVGVNMVVRAKSKKHLNLFQVVMLGIVFLNVLSPTLTLQGTCNGFCKNPDSETFRECVVTPQMLPCPHLCEIRSTIFAMTGLALFCILLQISLSSLWNGIEGKDPYANLFQDDTPDDKTMPGNISGFNGMIPMFDISINPYEDLIFGDTKEFKSDPSINDQVVTLLPEHHPKKTDINYTGLATMTEPSPTKTKRTSLEGKSKVSKNISKDAKFKEFDKRLDASKHVQTDFPVTDSFSSLAKPDVHQAIPKMSSKGFDTSERSKSRQASEILHVGGSIDTAGTSLSRTSHKQQFGSDVRPSTSTVDDKPRTSTITKTKKQLDFNVAKSPDNENDKANDASKNKTGKN